MLEVSVKQQLGTLEFNYEELSQELAVALKKYNNLSVSADTITEAKSIRALLNKVKTAIEDKRKDVKREFLEPYTTFENNVKKLTRQIDDVKGEIDKKIKELEDIEREEKRKEIEKFYDKIGYYTVPLDRMFDDKWLNKTNTTWKENLSGKIETIRADLATINMFDIEDKELMKTLYLDKLSITNATNEYNRINANKALIRENEELPTTNTKQEEITVKQSENDTTNEIKVGNKVYNSNEMVTRAFEVVGTVNQIIVLAKYMETMGITYKKIERNEDN